MTAPLAGLKVVELARILAGPWIGQTPADLGRRRHGPRATANGGVGHSGGLW